MLILRRALLVVGLCASSRVSNETFDGARGATPVLAFLRQRVASRASLRSARALGAPFNLTEKVRAQRARPCALAGLGPHGATRTVNLAVARTGSASVRDALRRLGWASHHAHECALEHVRQRGARRVLVSLRAPVARVVSGFQRREERSELNPAGRAARKGANQLLAAAFGSVDAFVDALRDPAHAQHAVALHRVVGNKGRREV